MLGHTEAVNLLVEQGADVDCRNRDGATPLLSAAFLGQAKPVRLLIENGADVNARNNAGYTPLAALAADWPLGLILGGLVFLPVFIVVIALPNLALNTLATVYHSTTWTLTYRELLVVDGGNSIQEEHLLAR